MSVCVFEVKLQTSSSSLRGPRKPQTHLVILFISFSHTHTHTHADVFYCLHFHEFLFFHISVQA